MTRYEQYQYFYKGYAREYQRGWRKTKKGRESIRETQTKRYAVRSAIILEAKNKPCKDCGHEFPSYVMDFDHVRGDKKFEIGLRGRGSSLEALREEIEKCDVVCSNCHRIRTFARKSKTENSVTLPEIPENKNPAEGRGDDSPSNSCI